MGLIKKAGSEAVFVEADINTDEGVETAVSETVSKLGSIDVLVNNAGYCIHKPALDVTRDDYRAVMGINMEALYFLSQAATKVRQKKGGGNIINVGSISALIVNRP